MARSPLNSLLPALLALLFVLSALEGRAQDIEPRRWSHLPIGSQFLGTAYAYTSADIYLDPVLRLEDVELDLHTLAAKYIWSFELLGKSARFDLIQAAHRGEWEGLLDGVPARTERDGLADTHLRFAVNLFGAPPLSGKEFAEYQASKESRTIFGVGLAMQLPTGEYLEDKLINLGNNRFNFRPQAGLVHNRGPWTVEVTAATWLFTDNEDFFNGKHLEQDPVYAADFNLIYTFRPGLWLGASVGYGIGGETVVDGRRSDNEMDSLGWGISLGVPITRSLGVKFGYTGIRTHASTGMDSNTFSCALSYMW